jgi:hypothetical protein
MWGGTGRRQRGEEEGQKGDVEGEQWALGRYGELQFRGT